MQKYYLRNSNRTEASEQTAVIDWCLRNEQIYPELKCLYHPPNGGGRNPVEAKHLKEQGVKPGVPDLSLPVPKGRYSGLFLEMKQGRNKETPNQAEWLTRLQQHGNFVAVCYSAEAAIKAIRHYLALRPGESMPYLPDEIKGYPILRE